MSYYLTSQSLLKGCLTQLRGTEGKGILHYSFGTGEYLDDFCMRKARIASGSDEAKPLPLSYVISLLLCW